jgi:hypothetical protein
MSRTLLPVNSGLIVQFVLQNAAVISYSCVFDLMSFFNDSIQLIQASNEANTISILPYENYSRKFTSESHLLSVMMDGYSIYSIHNSLMYKYILREFAVKQTLRG